VSPVNAPAADAASIARRLASMVYEGLLLFAVAFAGTWVFFFASGGHPIEGMLRHLLQLYLAILFAGYFLWCWLRGGQTLAMKAWRIRVIAPGHARLPPRLALARLIYAAVSVGAFVVAVVAAFAHRDMWLSFASLSLCGLGLGWALVDRDRQFLHDRLAGTRLVQVAKAARS
jgi:uncharacterized RDD family membrane protein YckC